MSLDKFIEANLSDKEELHKIIIKKHYRKKLKREFIDDGIKLIIIIS
ncbi:hypothetical protein ACVPOR_14005 [Staphylococcus aureus]